MGMKYEACDEKVASQGLLSVTPLCLMKCVEFFTSLVPSTGIVMRWYVAVDILGKGGTLLPSDEVCKVMSCRSNLKRGVEM